MQRRRVVAVTVLWLATLLPPVPVAASTSATYVQPLPCGRTNLDPWTTASSLTALPDPGRPYDEIHAAVAQGNYGVAPDGSTTEAVFDLQLCGPIPPFPLVTDNGDLGLIFTVCMTPAPSGPLQNGPLVVGLDHRGGPVFDGPYPGAQGWKACTWADVEASSIDWGVAVYDPQGYMSTSYDATQLVNVQGVPTISAPTGLTAGSTMVSLYMPYQWRIQVPGADGGSAPPHLRIEPWITPGDTVTNVVATTQVILPGQSPVPVCDTAPASAPFCSGSPTVGPVYGVTSQNALTDFIPGFQECFTPFVNCVTDGYGYDLGLSGPQGRGDFVSICGGSFAPACGNVAGAWNYYPCLPVDSWPADPGQGPLSVGHLIDPQNSKPPPAPYYQDAGEPGRVGCPEGVGPPVSLAYQYTYTNGRAELPPLASHHLGHTYLPAPQLDFIA